MLDESGITFGFVVADAVASSTGADSVCVSTVGVSTVHGTTGALSFSFSFLRAIIDGIAVDLQKDEEEGKRSSFYH